MSTTTMSYQLVVSCEKFEPKVRAHGTFWVTSFPTHGKVEGRWTANLSGAGTLKATTDADLCGEFQVIEAVLPLDERVRGAMQLERAVANVLSYRLS